MVKQSLDALAASPFGTAVLGVDIGVLFLAHSFLIALAFRPFTARHHWVLGLAATTIATAGTMTLGSAVLSRPLSFLASDLFLPIIFFGWWFVNCFPYGGALIAFTPVRLSLFFFSCIIKSRSTALGYSLALSTFPDSKIIAPLAISTLYGCGAKLMMDAIFAVEQVAMRRCTHGNGADSKNIDAPRWVPGWVVESALLVALFWHFAVKRAEFVGESTGMVAVIAFNIVYGYLTVLGFQPFPFNWIDTVLLAVLRIR